MYLLLYINFTRKFFFLYSFFFYISFDFDEVFLFIFVNAYLYLISFRSFARLPIVPFEICFYCLIQSFQWICGFPISILFWKYTISFFTFSSFIYFFNSSKAAMTSSGCFETFPFRFVNTFSTMPFGEMR